MRSKISVIEWEGTLSDFLTKYVHMSVLADKPFYVQCFFHCFGIFFAPFIQYHCISVLVIHFFSFVYF